VGLNLKYFGLQNGTRISFENTPKQRITADFSLGMNGIARLKYFGAAMGRDDLAPAIIEAIFKVL
jgi:hypothetical protein